MLTVVATKDFVKQEVVEQNSANPWKFIRSWNSAQIGNGRQGWTEWERMPFYTELQEEGWHYPLAPYVHVTSIFKNNYDETIANASVVCMFPPGYRPTVAEYTSAYGVSTSVMTRYSSENFNRSRRVYNGYY
jgi:hypothetical protein